MKRAEILLSQSLTLLLICMMLLSCAAPVCAEAAGVHEIVMRSYPTYIGNTAEDALDQEFL